MRLLQFRLVQLRFSLIGYSTAMSETRLPLLRKPQQLIRDVELVKGMFALGTIQLDFNLSNKK